MADLVILDMKGFDIIQGMDQLSPYIVILDCYAKIVTIVMHKNENLDLEGTFKFPPVRTVSSIHA